MDLKIFMRIKLKPIITPTMERKKFDNLNSYHLLFESIQFDPLGPKSCNEPSKIID